MAQGLSAAGLGPGEITALIEEFGQVEMPLGIFGIDFQGLLEAAARLFDLSLSEAGVTEECQAKTESGSLASAAGSTVRPARPVPGGNAPGRG